MPRSAAQIEAARRNGARSRGPCTPGGKARSSVNTLRHGLCAQSVTPVSVDHHPEFAALLLGLRAAYRPIDAQEQELVRAIALASWQVRRSHELELRYWQEHSAIGEEVGRPGPGLETILRYQARAETARSRAMRELKLYRSGQLHRSEPDSVHCTNEPEQIRLRPAAAPRPALPVLGRQQSGAREYQHLMERYVQANPVTVLEALIRTGPSPE